MGLRDHDVGLFRDSRMSWKALSKKVIALYAKFQDTLVVSQVMLDT